MNAALYPSRDVPITFKIASVSIHISTILKVLKLHPRWVTFGLTRIQSICLSTCDVGVSIDKRIWKIKTGFIYSLVRRASVFLGQRLMLENTRRLYSPEVERLMFPTIITNTCWVLVCVLSQLTFSVMSYA